MVWFGMVEMANFNNFDKFGKFWHFLYIFYNFNKKIDTFYLFVDNFDNSLLLNIKKIDNFYKSVKVWKRVKM